MPFKLPTDYSMWPSDYHFFPSGSCSVLAYLWVLVFLQGNIIDFASGTLTKILSGLGDRDIAIGLTGGMLNNENQCRQSMSYSNEDL